jgi:hypothetical protein
MMTSELDDAIMGGKSERKELLPRLLANMHRVPKQVVDTCVSVGGNLKLIDSGMPAPVLLPSQIAHDRMLSVNDGIMDAFIINLFLIITALFGYGTTSYIIAFIMSVYWVFHIAWWQETRQWISVRYLEDYIAKTYNFYMPTFIIFLMLISVGSFFVLKQYQLIENPITERISKSDFGKFIESDFGEPKAENKGKVSNTMGVFSSIKKEKIIELKLEKEKEKEDIGFTSSDKTVDYFFRFLLNFSIFSFLTIVAGSHFKKKFKAIHDKMQEETAKELNDDLTNKQDELQAALQG